ncbi:TonB-dependent receptor [Kordia algicida OT-1]|uniref:TonB-dependent outer membrane receptor n=1 Tax=Kordia algicida OT-1 TaxID=391587 RepID=A9DN90_9FLAO|nr:TonB-dependent receptor [Kordia algicida]EDP97137.1 TonB-dependent outer membrane receptor [Kordia algicida OT-1]
MNLKISLLFAFLCSASFSQTTEIKGVISHKSSPQAFVNVYIKNGDKGTITEHDGTYSLKVAQGKYTLVVQAIGFKTIEKEITVGKTTLLLNFNLKEDLLGLDQVVVSATKTELNRREAPVLVTVTNAESLKNVQAATLFEGLNFQPGLRTEVNCQNCGFSQIRINGLDGAYSQILVNSRPVFGSLNGIYGLEQIPTNMIKQIEVTRGGGSAIFGSNAIAGTINIITKDPIENQFQVASKVGLIDGKSVDAVTTFNSTLVAGDLNKGITFFGMYREREGYDNNDDGFTEMTKLRNLNFGFKSFYKFDFRRKLTLEFNTTHEYRRGGDFIDKSPIFANIAEEITSNVIGGGITFDYFSEDYLQKFSAYGNIQNTSSDNYYGTNQDPNGFGVTKDFVTVSGIQHTAKFENFFNGSMDLTSGVEHRFNRITERRENPLVNQITQNTNTLGIYTQLDWKILENLKLLTGARGELFTSNLNDESLFIVNPRASLLYNITETISFRTGYSQGFRAPQFFSEDVHSEIISGEVRRVRLAADLKKELSHSFIGSLEYSHQHEDHQLVLTFEGFYTTINDPFVYEARGEVDGLEIKEKINGDNAIVNGFNLEARFSPNPKFLFQLGGTFQNSYFENSYEPEEGIVTNKITRTPNVYGNMMVNFTPNERWDFNLNGVYTGRMFVPHVAGFIPETVLEETPNLLEIGLNASRTFTLSGKYQFEINGGVKNLFNAYQDDFDQTIDRDPNYIYGPAQPRTVFLGLKFGTDL